MEREEEITSQFGKTNFDLVFEDIERAIINHDHIKEIACKMGHGVHGVYMSRKSDHSPANLFRRMLDHWFNQHVHKPDVDALKEFISILRDVKLLPLALALETNSEDIQFNR